MEGGGEFSVNLEGGSPWGFTLQGGLDHHSPLRIGRVTSGGRAARAGLVAGDYILAINDQSSKQLKHLQAQQIIKRSPSSLLLQCTKVRPGLTSPAVTNNPPPTFSFPVSNGNRTIPTKIKPFSITSPKPPPQSGVVTNGHARSGSLGTPSDTSGSSPSPLSSVDVYDVKFTGMDYSSGPPPALPLTTTPQSNHTSDTHDGNYMEPEQEQESMPEPTPNHTSTEDPDDGPILDPIIENPIMNASEVEEDVMKEVEEISAVMQDIEKEVEDIKEEVKIVEDIKEEVKVVENIKDEEVVEDITEEVKVVEDIKEEEEVKIAEDIKEEVKGSGGEVVIDGSDEISLQKGSNNGSLSSVTKEASPPLCPEEDRSREGVGSRRQSSSSSRRNSFSKRELAEVITQAAQARVRRGHSLDLTSTYDGLVFSPAPAPQQHKQQAPVVRVSVVQPPMQQAAPVIKPTLRRKSEDSDPLIHKTPGWYQSMFQSFTNQVEECFPGVKKTEKDSSPEEVEGSPGYVYDHRGLKVRRDSISKTQSDSQADQERATIPSPESPVYMYDYRGLRVPRKAGVHVRGGSTPAIMEGATDKQTQGTKFISVSSGGTTKEDVLASSKKPTSYKAHKYTTEYQRDYWSQKDKEHINFDRQRRLSQEKIEHRRNSSLDYSSKMTSMHPLLRESVDDSDKKGGVATQEGIEQGSVFSRIDPTKLQGALTNASMLGTLEQEGVPSHLLPAVAQSKAAATKEEKKNQLKPPPGLKALANFDFEGQKEKELTFKKGDFIELLHTVDANWLEGSIHGKTGIFPTNYVRVLSASECDAMISSQAKPEAPKKKAQALYDFQGQTEKELNFVKGEILTVDKKVDDNWFSGFLGDKKGIFPITYVEIIED